MMRQTVDGIRVVWIVLAVLVAAGSATSNPPPQVTMPPPSQQPQSQAPGATAATAQYSPCEYACGQVARCQLAPYEMCLGECRRTGTEQQPGGREQLDGIARMSCEQLASVMQQSASTAATPQAPPATAAPSQPPIAAPPPMTASTPSAASSAAAGRWISPSSMAYTNAAMVSADIHLEVAVASDGTFRGSWARYLCLVQTYGIWSCGKGDSEGAASGRLEANGTGSIELERIGRSTLTWRVKSASEIAVELPRDWQGGVLFRSTLKR
jgi:hypothetical protein